MNSDLKKRNAEVLKKWLDGAEIEARSTKNPGLWTSVHSYEYCDMVNTTHYEYRLKPKTVKFRTALFKYSLPNTGMFVSSVLDAKSENSVEQLPQFVRWLTDWQEVSEDDPNS